MTISSRMVRGIATSVQVRLQQILDGTIKVKLRQDRPAVGIVGNSHQRGSLILCLIKETVFVALR